MKGRATVLAKTNVLETWEVSIADPEPGGVVVSIVLGGVCGSDVHILTGEAGEMPFPIVLGHEGIGRIESLGSGTVTDHAGATIKAGDLVYWSPIALCRRCYACNVLDETPCDNTRFFEDASKPNWGSYADYAWLPGNMPFFRLPDHAKPEAVAALGCALPTALRGFENGGPVRVNDTVVVQGAGPVGLSAVMLARLAGAREVIAIDGSPARLEAARRLGATEAIGLDVSPDERRRRISDRVGAHGPNIVVEAAGALPAFPEGIELSGTHGRYIILGLWGAIGTQPISPREITLKNLTISGVTYPKPKHYYEALHTAVALQDKLPLAELISHRFAIGQAAEALDLTRRGGVIKAVIDPTIG